MELLTDYTMMDIVDLKTMAKPWYGLNEDLTQQHDTVTVETLYHFFCFALLNPQEGIDELHLDEKRYLINAHDLLYNDVKGDVLFESQKRTKALGLFLGSNPAFLFQYRAGMRLVKNLAQKAADKQRRYADDLGLNYLNDVGKEWLLKWHEWEYKLAYRNNEWIHPAWPITREEAQW